MNQVYSNYLIKITTHNVNKAINQLIILISLLYNNDQEFKKKQIDFELDTTFYYTLIVLIKHVFLLKIFSC